MTTIGARTFVRGGKLCIELEIPVSDLVHHVEIFKQEQRFDKAMDADRYVWRLIERYLRMVRYTCHDQSLHYENIIVLQRELSKKRLGNAIRAVHWLTCANGFVGDEAAWVDGQHISYCEHPKNKRPPSGMIDAIRRMPQTSLSLRFRKHHPVSSDTSPKSNAERQRRFRERHSGHNEARAIASAVYELGLINPGELNHDDDHANSPALQNE